MNNRPIHQNLDTSYVDLSSLVQYLRKRQFVGSIKISLSGYTAEILINEKNPLKVRERDLITGRVSEGVEAFKKLLIRAREPGGTIDVYQRRNSKSADNRAVPKVSKPPRATALKPKKEIPVPDPIVDFAREGQASPPVRNGKNGHVRSGYLDGRANAGAGLSKTNTYEEKIPERLTSLPDFPFELTNSVEQKAQNKELAADDWQILLKLTVEILGVVDRSLSTHHLDFAAAFRKARAEIADDYPFMNPSSGVFDYQNHRIMMGEQVNHTVFVRSIVESLKRILVRLGGNPKFDILYRDTAHMIIELIRKRGPHYDRYGFTSPLRNMLGI